MNSSAMPQVFISYAREDSAFAERLYSDLQRAGIRPWLDRADLIPGQHWESAIRRAIAASSYFIAVLSSRSVSKRGFVQSEIRFALRIADEYAENQIFIIPVRLDDCEPSFEGLRELHRADLFPSYDQGLKELLRVFAYSAEEKPALVEVAAGRIAGIVKTLTDRGFGFVRTNAIKGDIFFHYTELRGVTIYELKVGDAVLFSAAEGPKGPAATQIERA